MFYMASTKIAAEKTAAEITALLGWKGAKKILMEYDNGEIVAVSFTITIGPKEIPFRLPVRWRACLEAMHRDRTTPRHLCKEEQAKRVAWRVVLRWLQAQLALVETGMVDLAEVMLPYVQMGERTFYEALAEKSFKALPDLGGKDG